MEKSIKRRGKRGGPTHKLWITMKKTSFEMLEAQGEKLGYSISFLAQQVIDRGLAAGLLYADTPSPQGEDVVRVTQAERHDQLTKELDRLHEEHTKLLKGRIDLLEEWVSDLRLERAVHAEIIEKQARDIEGYERSSLEAAETITQQDRDIQFYEQARVHDVEDDADRLDG